MMATYGEVKTFLAGLIEAMGSEHQPSVSFPAPLPMEMHTQPARHETVARLMGGESVGAFDLCRENIDPMECAGRAGKILSVNWNADIVRLI